MILNIKWKRINFDNLIYYYIYKNTLIIIFNSYNWNENEYLNIKFDNILQLEKYLWSIDSLLWTKNLDNLNNHLA